MLGLGLSLTTAKGIAGPAPDPDPTTGYAGRFSPLSIDPSASSQDDAVTVWNNLNTSGVGNMAMTDTTLHIESGERQVNFTGGNKFGTILNANFNPVPGTDEFSIMFKIGHQGSPAGQSQQIIGKSQLNMVTSGQFALFQQSGSARFDIGGTSHIQGTEWVAGDTCVMTVRTDGMDVYKNNVKILDNVAVGTVSTTEDTRIGGRYQGAHFNYTGTLSHVYLKTSAVDAAEATAVHNWMNS